VRNFFFCLCLTFAASTFGAQVKFDFGEYQTGSSPTNFEATVAGDGSPGGWKIVDDSVPSAFTPFSGGAPLVNQRGVLAQTGGDLTDEHFPMLVYQGDIYRNFKFTERFKIVSGVTEQMAGMVFRYQNASNFYVLRASALGHNIRFYKVVDGIRSEPIGTDYDISAGGWHTLAVQCSGNEITCWLDDKLVMPPLQDNTFGVGKLGFWTKSDSVTYFSEATIDYTPRIPAAQALVNDIMEKQPRILTLRIYALGDGQHPKIIASNNAAEIGQPGEDAEQNAITDGTVSFGKSAGVVAVTLPFRDRNGDPIAAVRIRLKSFFGETQDNAVTRATQILKLMQAQIGTSKDLME
jgi:hypothetical protein